MPLYLFIYLYLFPLCLYQSLPWQVIASTISTSTFTSKSILLPLFLFTTSFSVFISISTSVSLYLFIKPLPLPLSLPLHLSVCLFPCDYFFIFIPSPTYHFTSTLISVPLNQFLPLPLCLNSMNFPSQPIPTTLLQSITY